MAEIRTIEQDRVAAALSSLAKLGHDEAKTYYREAAGFGPLVISNGLAGAIAFVVGKSKSPLPRHLDEWIAGRNEFKRVPGETVLEKVASRECDAATYRAMTIECLSYVNWLKRLAAARSNGR